MHSMKVLVIHLGMRPAKGHLTQAPQPLSKLVQAEEALVHQSLGSSLSHCYVSVGMSTPPCS